MVVLTPKGVDSTTLVGLRNTGTVSFTDCGDVIVASVDNTAATSVITFTNSRASLLNVNNGGAVTTNGGSYAWFGGANTGEVTGWTRRFPCVRRLRI